jgi:hypothetical protein
MFVCDWWAKIVLFPYRTEYAEASAFFWRSRSVAKSHYLLRHVFLSIHPSIRLEEHGITQEGGFSIDLDGSHSYLNV